MMIGNPQGWRAQYQSTGLRGGKHQRGYVDRGNQHACP